MDLSIILVNYKQKDFTMNCIKSIKEANFQLPDKKLSYEIIVVDNNSEDGVGEVLSWQNPEVKFFQNKKNLGMGRANNIGIKEAVGDYVVIMNPDTIAMPDTFYKLYQYMEQNHEVGVIGPKQFNMDKSVQNSCYRWYGLFTPMYRRTPIGGFAFAQKDLNRFLMKDFDCNKILEVDWLLGSFLFCRKEALNEVGLFDERFFLYFEDTDFCRRFWKKGWKVVYNPETKIIHNHSRHSAKVAWYKFFTNVAARHHIISWVKYLLKWGWR